jgi:polyhydroxyalkanoate synthesis regulator phasin
MTLDDINQSLANLVNSGDQQFASAAQYVQQVVQQVQSGQLDPADAKEVLGDIQKQLDIIDDMGQMALKETMNTVINGLIALAGAA